MGVGARQTRLDRSPRRFPAFRTDPFRRCNGKGNHDDPAFTKLKPLLTLLVGFLAALGVLSLTHVGPAQAQSPGVTLAQLVATVNTLKAQVAALQADNTALKAKTAPLSLSNGVGPNTELTFTGVNVRIVSGHGYTDDGTGGEGRELHTDGPGRPDRRLNAPATLTATSGPAHTLVSGDGNNYSRYGGLVAGDNNTISGNYASVSGGQSNTASGSIASVSGGDRNTASGLYASVTGGDRNTASGTTPRSPAARQRGQRPYASVSGGDGNTASG